MMTLIVRLPWLALGLAGVGIVVILRFPYESPSAVPSSTTTTTSIPPETKTKQQDFVLDIVSTGSISRPDYHVVQQRAFKSHPAVRHFYPLTEANDTEATCHTDLVWNRVRDTLTFCRRRPTNHSYLDGIRQYFGITGNGNLIHYDHDLAKGWLCAQKRPIDGLVKVLQSYRRRWQSEGVDAALPDYLVLTDNDTWMNVTKVTENLRANYPSHEPLVLTGCLIWMDVEGHAWSWTWGGYGTFFSKATLERLLQPIYCDSDNSASNDFVRNVCRRLEQNLIGEQSAFRPGMSVADLMERYTFRHAYLDVKNWTDVGFCLHSDHVWTYFAQYYYLSSTNPVPTFAHAEQDRIYPYHGDSRIYPMMRPKNPDREKGQCLNKDDDEACTANAHICHRISAERMASLWGISL